MHLTISRISDADEGDYFCHAENAFGTSTQPVSVRIRNVVSIIRLAACREDYIPVVLYGYETLLLTFREG
jgi:hypothetical protein